jgi:hypothetical protein
VEFKALPIRAEKIFGEGEFVFLGGQIAYRQYIFRGRRFLRIPNRKERTKH